MNVKKIVFFCACALSAMSLSAQTTDTTAVVKLTLDECLRIALNESPTVKVADMEVERYDYSKIETLSNLLPQVSFAGNYSRTLKKQVMYMNMDLGSFGGGGLPGGSTGGTTGDETGDDSSTPASRAGKNDGGNKNGIKVGLDNSFQLGFQASVPLIAPQLWASLKLSDSQILAAVEQARASRLNLVNQVKNAYYALMLATESRGVLQESYDMAAFTHDLYVKMQDAGTASEFDVLRTSVAMKNIEPQILQADIAIKQARLQLLILMGINPDTQLQVAESLASYQDTMFAEALAMDGDYTNNTQLVLNDIQTQQLHQALKVQKAAIYPTLAASANYMFTSMSNGAPWKNFKWTPYSTLGLSLSLPLFTGGARYSRIRQAEVQIDEMRWQRENLERSVAMQVDLAKDNIKLNIEQITSCDENVGQAERAHNIMEQSFKIGAASYLDLRDSELALTQTRLAYYQAIYNLKVAQSSLELLQGNAPIDRYAAGE